MSVSTEGMECQRTDISADSIRIWGSQYFSLGEMTALGTLVWLQKGLDEDAQDLCLHIYCFRLAMRGINPR